VVEKESRDFSRGFVFAIGWRIELFGFDFFVPGVCALESLIDVVDVFYAGGVEPVFEGLGALLGVDGDAVFPGGAAAEDSVEAGAGFYGELEGFDEDGVGDAGREVDEGFVGHSGGVAEVLQGFGAGVGLFAFVGLGAFDEGHLDGNFDFEDVDVVAGFAELGHGAGDDFGFQFGVGEGLFIAAVDCVADELEEEGDVVGDALVADALDPGLLEVVDVGFFEGGVVEEDLDAVGSGFLETANAPDVEEVWQAAGGGGVVAGLLVGEEEALAVALLGGGEAELGVEEDGGGVFGEDGGDEGLEDFKVVGVGGCSTLLGEGLLQGAALVHGGGGDDAAVVGDCFESC
jgi:hypothetical protein